MSETTTAEGADGTVRIVSGFTTDRGLRRELNEDSLIVTDTLFAVADGMGGHEAGEVASGVCVRTLGESELLSGSGAMGSEREITAAQVQELLERADAAIREETDSRAGTTLTGVVLTREAGRPYWLFFNVGDSRSYRLYQHRLRQISVDHSEVQELVDLGHITPEEALVHPRRHVVTRALGTGVDIAADFWLLPVEPGERILLCSDGLTVEVPDDAIGRVLDAVADPQTAADALVQAAVANGGRDNVTVVVIDAVGGSDGEDEAHTTAPRPHDDEDTLPRRAATGSTAVPPPADSTSASASGDRPGP
ncbi:PP2C family serine/threonine-protein phosphatase [Tersicoccus sp. Bi-70]|uniref:PP2C family protein-serine/threonine phosphatase n=1 Tax=Tersicoccus sp. Bi-70 TaxID=1897634 RepID=UPI000977DF20|nr:protein phosphatase 2C domain-containing protein [Tersicoccus sp. Bi-70]OMH31320.1 serine/threonine protein phosphatase [Tersicoccus sp. Bi-70]